MHICTFPHDQFNVRLQSQKLNIILAEEGNLFLPEADAESIWLQILFTEKGSFTISGSNKEIFLGYCHDKSVTTNPGNGIF